MIEYLRDLVSKSKEGEKYGKFATKPYIPCTTHCNGLILHLFDCLKFLIVGNYVLKFADDFAYTDPVSFSTIHFGGLCLN